MIFIRTSNKLIILCLVFVSIISCSSQSVVHHQLFKQPSQTIVIRNANILSDDGQSMLSNRNLLVKDGVIELISDNNITIDNAREIDGRGKFIIPGLIDSHVHLQKSENDLLVYLAYGVTYIREMSGNDEHLEWRSEIQQGRVGPSIEVSSEKISSKSGIWGIINSLFWNRINISSKQQAHSLAAELLKDGYQNAKISSDINKPMYLAITKASKQNGLAVTGHIPQSITFEGFIQSGQKEIAHIEELVKMLNREFGYYTSATSKEFLNYVSTRSHEVAQILKAHQISVGTTFWYMQSIPKQIDNLEELISRIDFSFTNPERVTEWMPGNNTFEREHASLLPWWKAFAKANELVLDSLIRNHVTILVGTDAMTTMVVPGASLHQELQALVEYGMPVAQALMSVTSIPASWMGEKVGRIKSGYTADLLILNDNPLDNIENTRNIHAVIKSGKLYSRETIADMLDSVRQSYK